jgi:hypothetical protein
VRAKFEIQKDVLKKLIKEYWKQGAAVTHNENFLELIEAIAPYTNDVEVLYPESMKNSQSRKLFSDQYRKILREPPHRLVIDKEVEQKAGADEKLAANPSAKAAVSSVGITIPTQNPADTKADSPTVLQSAYEYVTSWWSSTPETKPQPPKEQPSISKTEEASSQKANDKSRSSAAAVMPLLSAPATEVINATVGMATTKLQAGLNQAQLSQDTTAFATKAVTAVKTYANDTVKLFKDIRAIAPMTVAELTLRRYGEQTTEEPSAPAQISRKTL